MQHSHTDFSIKIALPVLKNRKSTAHYAKNRKDNIEYHIDTKILTICFLRNSRNLQLNFIPYGLCNLRFNIFDAVTGLKSVLDLAGNKIKCIFVL